jgi:hypothetical protein
VITAVGKIRDYPVEERIVTLEATCRHPDGVVVLSGEVELREEL